MGKSIRSKVKKKFRSIKRTQLEPQEVAKNARLHAKDKEAVQSMSLNAKLAPQSVINSSMTMDVEGGREVASRTRIRKKARKPLNHKQQTLKKKVGTYFKKKKK